MNIKENREKLISALESGDYEKGKFNLNKSGKYCCLGVACEVAGIKPELYSKLCMKYRYNGETQVAPDHVIEYFGFYDDNGSNESPREKSLIDINDKSDTFEPVIKALKSGQYWKPIGQ